MAIRIQRKATNQLSKGQTKWKDILKEENLIIAISTISKKEWSISKTIRNE